MACTVLLGAWLALLAGVDGAWDPAVAVRDLLGPVEGRRAALQTLELEGDLPISGVKLVGVQMDTDAELEAVLVVDVGWAQHVIVSDRVDGKWQIVGRLALPSNAVVEWREVVEAGVLDLVIEEAAGGAGGGVAQTRLSIYHLRGGILMDVYGAVSFVSVCADERRRVEFPRVESTERGYLVERLTSKALLRSVPSVCGKPKPMRRMCTAYRWDGEAGRMVRDTSPVGIRRCAVERRAAK